MDMKVCTNDLLFALAFYYEIIVIMVAILKTKWLPLLLNLLRKFTFFKITPSFLVRI